MRSRKNIQKENEEDKDYIRPFTLWGMAVCCTILILIGTYCLITHQAATDSGLLHGRRGDDRPITLNGQEILILGLLVSIVPAYFFFKQQKRLK
ncbi:MAG TPA: hypothetical protein VIJ92_02170 [Ginsengibacter sp.]